MTKLKVLVGFECSQRIVSAFRDFGEKKGYDVEAYSLDLEPPSPAPGEAAHPEWHIQSDIAPFLLNKPGMTFMTYDGKSHTLDGRFDLMILQPNCKLLSVAGASRYWKEGVLDEERYKRGLEA